MNDYYIVDECSDNEYYSSDDECDAAVWSAKNEGEDDDFAAEMERERDARFAGDSGNDQRTGDEQQMSPSCSLDDESSRDSNSNDAIFYDPKADDRDERWVSDLRRVANSTESGESRPKLANSDATLNCPFCMSLLCLDCQRHEVYKTQYRAMFAFNCFVDFSQKLEYKGKAKKRKHRLVSSLPTEIYYPVKCTVCGTQVAVYDNDEVYHFFNVLSSVS
ncbi:E2F-associated phosphoprotein-like protein [Dinothrombium tinctorium]|uniref:E2F-associated phosphoprotein-like protein n=1 Tax=Dinothrombium tinctorium TaxID=1965070 RepID=A0A3S3QAX3_9ACAR|nr:E2F-associated phosphoprotein-like protein [Dinothrombium tinctorium]